MDALYDTAYVLMQIAIWGPIAIVLAYLVVRAGSVAYFRTKFEHFRRTRHLNQRSKSEVNHNGRL